MEAILLKVEQNVTDKLHWISKHVPISVSIDGYNNPKCFVDISPQKLISKMMEYLNEISEINANNLKMKFKYVFEAFDELLERYSVINENEEEQETLETDISANTHPKIVSHFISSINEVRKNFEKYLCQLPVLGFNSGKYDINLIKKEIMLFISEKYNDNEIFTIKKKILTFPSQPPT